MQKCQSCGRDIERPTLVDGIRYCGQCAMWYGGTIPEPKRIAPNWKAFTSQRRRKRPA